ncbi:hypothetical protein ABZZ79_25005 [Streptomyces sp. NPDC006458]|uniref:hypothetical protein n=1 Tax=Streptomyces sp. NPDC006458 TaxID=3154302 RepID=UPI0033BD160C
MSEAKEDEILKKVGEVQKDVTTVKDLISPPNQAATKKQLDDKTESVLKAIKAGPETSKNIFESLFEALGLKDLFGAIKDGENWGSKLVLAFGAFAALLLGKLLDFGRLFGTAFERLSAAYRNRNTPAGDPRLAGRLPAVNETGFPKFMTRVEMDAMNSVAINPHGLTPQLLTELTSALNGLTPEIRLFNSATRNMESPSTIKKIAAAIGKLKDVLTPTNPAESVREVAGAIGELNTKMQNYKPENLPKPQTFRDITNAAKELNNNVDTLRGAFQRLASATTGAANSLTGGSASPA